MSFGFGFALPAYPLRGGTGNNPFNQLGPTLDLSFTGVVTDLTDPNGYTLNTDFIIPQYQIAAQYLIWETGVGLVDKTFSQIITFTRASIGTYFDSAGVLQTATSGTPRFDYDPVTLAPRGFLIEEARTNLMLYSEQFDNASGWTSTRASVSANATTAPTGTSVADKIVEDTTASNTHLTFSANVTVATATIYTYSVYAKAAGRTWFNMQIETGSGAYGATVPFCYFNLSGAGSIGTNVSATGSITPVGNGWYRCVLVAVATTSASTTNMRIKLATGDGVEAYTGDGTSGIFVFGAQLEAGAFPTSYIPTTTGTVPRAADVANVNTLSPWFNSTVGTIYVEASNAQVQASLFSTDDGTASNRIVTYFNVANSPAFRVVSGGVDQCNYSAGTITQNAAFKLAAAYQVNDFAASLNGAAVVTDTSGTIPTGQTTARIGTNVALANSINGYLRRIVYYPRRLTNDELRTITLPAGATITTQDYSLDTNFVGNTVAIGS